MDYCKCELPIRMKRKTSDNYKRWFCCRCEKQVDPLSKSIDKHIKRCNIEVPTRNEIVLQDKLNEIIELLKASGLALGEN